MGSPQQILRMKWTTYLLFVASVAMANPSKDRTQKSFSLFSIVQFPNDQCQTNMVDMLGICITAEECDAQEGGSAAGNCASGFGVCCFTMISDPATAITNNMTYIQNDGFPTGVGATGTVAAVNRAYSIQGELNFPNQARFCNHSAYSTSSRSLCV